MILLQDVAKLGRKFDIVDVPTGYGINKLIPKGMAKPATPENVKAINERASVYAHEAEVNEDAFSELVAALKGVTITVTAEANAEGRLFQALKPDQIASAITENVAAKMSAVEISITDPIKTIGEHTVTLALGQLQHPLTINVVAA